MWHLASLCNPAICIGSVKKSVGFGACLWQGQARADGLPHQAARPRCCCMECHRRGSGLFGHQAQPVRRIRTQQDAARLLCIRQLRHWAAQQ